MRRPCVRKRSTPNGSADGSGAIHAKILPPVRRHARRRGPGCRDRTASARGLAPGPSPRSAAWPTDPDTQDPRIEQGQGRRPMPARQGRETRLARLINHRTTTMETQERAHLVIDAGGQPQRRIHIHQRQQQRDHRRRHPRRHPAIRLDLQHPSRMRQRLQRHPERRLRPDRRIRKPRLRRRPANAGLNVCACMSISIPDSDPTTRPAIQTRKSAKPHPSLPHHTSAASPRRPSQAGRADPAPPVRSRRPWGSAAGASGIYSPRTMVKNSTRVRRHLRLPRHAFLAATRQRCDQLPLHGLMPFRQLQQRVGHGGLLGVTQRAALHIGDADHAVLQGDRAARQRHLAQVETRAGAAAARAPWPCRIARAAACGARAGCPGRQRRHPARTIRPAPARASRPRVARWPRPDRIVDDSFFPLHV